MTPSLHQIHCFVWTSSLSLSRNGLDTKLEKCVVSISLCIFVRGLLNSNNEITLSFCTLESLVEESDNKHALRSRLVLEISTSLRMAIEPVQSIVSEVLPSVHDSAIQVGGKCHDIMLKSYKTKPLVLIANLFHAERH